MVRNLRALRPDRRHQTAHEDGFRTEYTKDQIKDAPRIDTDQEHLDATEERRLYDHYGMNYDATDHESTYGGRARADEGYDYTISARATIPMHTPTRRSPVRGAVDGRQA
jgi:hypothetical protein